MNLNFADPTLAFLETEQAARTRLPVAVIHSARQKIHLLRAAPDALTVFAWKSLGAIAINPTTGSNSLIPVAGWHMEIAIDEVSNPGKVTLVSISQRIRGAA